MSVANRKWWEYCKNLGLQWLWGLYPEFGYTMNVMEVYREFGYRIYAIKRPPEFI